MLRRLKTTALLTLLTLLLLELVLQAGALVVAWTHGGAPGPGSADGRRVVLCVGDSFTYGLGASSHEATSYPAQLQAQLDAAEPDTWRVVNAGYPGRNSRGVLERIDAQLAAWRPEFVAILVGLNDRWSQPARLDLGATPSAARGPTDGFRLEWRTRRLVLWLLGKLDDAAEAPAADPLALAGVEPFVPALPEDDPDRRADALGQGRAPDDLPSDPDELAQWVDALPKEPDGKALPALRAAAARLAASHPDAAIGAAVRAFLLTGDATRFREEMQRGGDRYEPAMLVGVFGRLELARGAREALAQHFADALGWKQGDGIWLHPETGRHAQFVTPRWLEFGPELLEVFDTHRFHLVQVVERCRAAGAEPFLVGYPNRISVPDIVFERVAAEAGVDFVSTVGAFEERLGEREPSALFVADGHCNDAGYALLAELVRRHLIGE